MRKWVARLMIPWCFMMGINDVISANTNIERLGWGLFWSFLLVVNWWTQKEDS